MNQDQFTIFAAVAKHRNVTRAAEELSISQPAVTRHLKLLEENYKAKLYTRGGEGIELTPAGHLFSKEVKAILARIESLRAKLGSATATRGESLTVGGSYSPSAVLLPSLLARFRKSHPQVELKLRTDNRSNIERLVLKGAVELAVVSNPTSNHRLAVEPYRTESLVAFVANRHPLAEKKQLTWENLVRHGFVVREPLEGDGATAQFIRRLKDRGVKLKVVMHCESPEAVKVAVRRRMGVGILFKDVIAHSLKKGDFKELTLPVEGLEGKTFIVYHKTRPLSPVAQDFLKLLRAHRARFKSKEQIPTGSKN
ncbi:MAG: LysR family transcriptional regulator [Deltaproteobacteria bacterium]|nr:LysR family transcriptional regulator [Deltaproteobacteria bacterium]